jgi:hypothetical protein
VVGATTTLTLAPPAAATGSTLFVSSTGTDTGHCSSASSPCQTITYALTQASPGATIEVSGTIHDNVAVTESVTVEQEPDGSPAVVDGGGDGRDFSISAGTTVTITGLTIEGGAASNGGGIDNGGTLTVDNSTISGDTADSGEGPSGGGIYSSGSLTLTDSTVSGNSAQFGGGITNNDGDLTIDNSTIAENSTNESGGGLYNNGYGGTAVATITDSTISDNSVPDVPGGAGINDNYGAITLAGDVLATPGGTSGELECIGGGYTDAGYNIDDDGSCGLSAATSVSDSPTIDSYLGSLTGNGGTTDTIPLLVTTDVSANPAEGVIPGTFTAPGQTTPVCDQSDQRGVARDSPCDMGSFALSLYQAPDILSAAAASFTVGTSGTFQILATGSPTGPSISEAGGTGLPAGVTLTSEGVLSGTPAPGTVGTYRFTVTASNGLNPDATQDFTLVVARPPVFTSPDSTTFQAGELGSFTVSTNGYPVTLSDGGATLPPGMTFVDNGNGTATLAGTPGATSGGTYPFTITAANGVDPDATQSFTLTVDQAPVITSPASATFTTGTPSLFTVATTGYPVHLSDGGTSLPQGVTFVDNGNGTATLAGTPGATSGGTYRFTITASNGADPDATQAFTLTVDQAPAITSAASSTFVAGTFGSFTITTTGFPKGPALHIGESGALPRGVTFTDHADDTATLSGTPALTAAGTYSITITASNGVDPDDTQSFTLGVDHVPEITSNPATAFAVGGQNSFTVTTSALPGVPTLRITESGALPRGVTFVDNGNGTAMLSGSPATGTGGIYQVTLVANDSIHLSARQAFVLIVYETPHITSGRTASFTVGTAGSFQVLATGFPGPAFAESGALPHGLVLSGNGLISGTPAAGTEGTYPLTLHVGNGLAAAAVQTLVLTVSDPSPVVGMAALPDGGGYWVVTAQGAVTAYGTAVNDGSMGGRRLNAPVVGITSTPDGGGYWLVASDGGVFAFGNAGYFGSMGAHPLNAAIVGLASTGNGTGYWEVASDGGIFAFGTARFAGSMGGQHLNDPIVGMAVDGSTGGYWLVASDGGIFSFDATFLGSTGDLTLQGPIVAMAATPDSRGYRLVGSDGGVFDFGNATYHGSTGGQPLTHPVVGMATDATTGGYWLVASDGGIFNFRAPLDGP